MYCEPTGRAVLTYSSTIRFKREERRSVSIANLTISTRNGRVLIPQKCITGGVACQGRTVSVTHAGNEGQGPRTKHQGPRGLRGDQCVGAACTGLYERRL